MSTTHDVIVIGAGPAGLAAATATATAGLRTLCIDKLAPGGALINLTQLHHVEGETDGTLIASQMTDAASEAGVELGFGEVVKVSGGPAWTVETAEGENHTARAVVVATGLTKGTLGLADEAEYEGRGVSHCATCDGPLYGGKPVVVAGLEGWAAQEAVELKGFTPDVTIVAGDASGAPAGVQVVPGRIVALAGNDEGLASIEVETGGLRKTLPAAALFIYAGQSPAAEFVPDSLARDATGHIVADQEGRTSAATAFAVGDVRAGSRGHLPDAIADGQRAGAAIVEALKA